jgi:hypothetical protein
MPRKKNKSQIYNGISKNIAEMSERVRKYFPVKRSALLGLTSVLQEEIKKATKTTSNCSDYIVVDYAKLHNPGRAFLDRHYSKKTNNQPTSFELQDEFGLSDLFNIDIDDQVNDVETKIKENKLKIATNYNDAVSVVAILLEDIANHETSKEDKGETDPKQQDYINKTIVLKQLMGHVNAMAEKSKITTTQNVNNITPVSEQDSQSQAQSQAPPVLTNAILQDAITNLKTNQEPFKKKDKTQKSINLFDELKEKFKDDKIIPGALKDATNRVLPEKLLTPTEVESLTVGGVPLNNTIVSIISSRRKFLAPEKKNDDDEEESNSWLDSRGGKSTKRKRIKKTKNNNKRKSIKKTKNNNKRKSIKKYKKTK